MGERAVFVSDVHLSGECAERTKRFLEFLDARRRDADVIFILGDLFDFWIGPKRARLEEYQAILDKLEDLSSTGVRVIFFAGNRDFYVCDYLTRELGVITIPRQQIFAVAGKRIFLTHGEYLWERSTAERCFNALYKSRQVEGLLTALPGSWAKALMRAYTDHCRRHNRHNSRKLVLQESEVLSAFKRGADAVVCGHAHKLLHQSYLVEGSERELFVLGSWHKRGTYLVLEEGRFQVREA